MKIKYAVKHSEGRVSLWLSIKEIINEMKNSNFFVLCEDDHQFTQYYSFELLLKCINEAQCLGADILSGGISWFKTGVQISKQLFWIDEFSGLQFTIIFKKFYQKILTSVFAGLNPSELKECFLDWIQSIGVLTDGRVIRIDGKRLCNAGTDGKKGFLHMLSAWCNANNIVIG